jgi:hypothetical protein
MQSLTYISFIVFCLFLMTCGKKQTGDSGISGGKQEPVSVSAQLSNHPDSLVRVELTLKMNKNIHILSSSSRSFEIKTVEATGLGAPSLMLPPPKQISILDGTKADAYSGTVKITLSCRVVALPWKIRGYVQYQACDDAQCFFPTKKWFSFSSEKPDTAKKALSDCEFYL